MQALRPSPAAFLSYVQLDDQHDRGRITKLRERLAGEVRMQSGRPFDIFQDRSSIAWGENWRRRIDESLDSATFLIPIVTPRYFQSKACRYEFTKFLRRERQLGVKSLILPIYYMECEELSSPGPTADQIAKAIRSRQWADWRALRFHSLQSFKVSSEVARQAAAIRETIKKMTHMFVRLAA